MRPFAYTRAESIDTAIAAAGADRRYLAGGTDLLTLMKAGISTPAELIDIKRVPEMDDSIVETGDGLTIGALASLSEVEYHPLVRASYPALTEAVAIAATPQLRNMATLGGNLLQRPRCWYYRSEHVTCWLKGGDECYARGGENQHHAIFGESPCVAAHPSDPAVALLAYDAEVSVRGADGERRVPIAELFAEPEDGRRRETTLGDTELITAIHLPALPGDVRAVYRKAMDRKVWAFALVSVAGVVTIDGGQVTGARLALGGVATVPWRASEAEALLVGQAPGAEVIERVAEAVVAGAQPLARNGYKVPLLRGLVRQALADALG